MPKAATARARSSSESSTSKLAKFFPEATHVRIPAREVLFASTLPLEFADMLRLQNSDGTLDTEACVVAVQYNGERKAVAARFTQPVTNWIVKL